jgi:hypothetical protein
MVADLIFQTPSVDGLDWVDEASGVGDVVAGESVSVHPESDAKKNIAENAVTESMR